MINLNLNFRGLCDFSFAPLREPFDAFHAKTAKEIRKDRKGRLYDRKIF